MRFLTATLLCILCSVMSNAQEIQQDSTKEKNFIFSAVETEASYPGGVSEWIKYLEKNLKGDVAADNGAPVGKYTVITKFVVNREGAISDIQATTHFGYGMEEEVVRVIKKSGLWQPAVQNGRTVNAYRMQPITFILDSDDFEFQSEMPYTLFTNKDNEVTITARKVKPEDISLTVPGGKVTPKGDGKFVVQVNKTGRVMIEIINTKKDKTIGTASIEIKSR